MTTKYIKNIIFDLGGVILNIDYNKTANAFKALGVTEFDSLYSQFKQNHVFDELEKGLSTESEFISSMQEIIPNATPQQIIDAWNAMLLDLPPIRIDLLKMVGKNYRIFLLSNTNDIHFKAYNSYIEKEFDLNFNSLFEHAYYSHEIHLRKPESECFEYVCETNNLKKEETLFIDDSVQHIEGAVKFGLNTIHHTFGCITKLFDKNGQLLPDLLA